MKKGKTIACYSYPLGSFNIQYPDMKYTDMIEKGYRFKTPTLINAIYLNRHEADNKEEFSENMFTNFNIEYLKDGKWNKVENNNVTVAENPQYNCLRIPEIEIDGLRFINSTPTDLRRHIYKIGIGTVLKENYNLRAMRDSDKMYLFIDGKEIGSFDVKLPASKVCLGDSDYDAQYNGVMYYHVVKNKNIK